jgi:hypothetical protein
MNNMVKIHPQQKIQNNEQKKIFDIRKVTEENY